VSRVIEVRPRAKEEWNAYLGTLIFLGTFAMLFAAMFFAYFVVRSQAVSWPPPAETPLPLALPGINTLVMLASSVALQLGIRSIREGRATALRNWLLAALVFGAVFLGLQLWVWSSLWAGGLRPSSGIYGSVLYGLTGFHAAHVLCGLGILLALLIKSARGRYSAARFTAVRVTSLFWHFIGVVWVVMFVTIYVF